MVGCPDWQHFTVERQPEILPMLLLWSEDQPGLSLPVVSPWLVEANYAPQLAEAERAALELAAGDEVEWLCILNVQPDGVISANLLGPLAFNRRTGAALQVIQAHTGYSPAVVVGQAHTEVAHAGADAAA
jgi:flagellar assembly factor FliW